MSIELPYSGGSGRRWGHYAPQLLSAAILGVIALAFRPYAVNVTTAAATGGLLIFVLLTWLKLRQHDRGLCEQCLHSMPLNAAEHAGRYTRRFWLAHSGGNVRYVVPYLAVLIATNFLTSTPGRIVWALAQSSMIYLIVAYSTHRKLQPWCPWCAGGGGGTEEFDLDPDLPKDNTRQLV